MNRPKIPATRELRDLAGEMALVTRATGHIGVARWHDCGPVRRIGSAIDVADAVLFLLSPAARWISGVNLVIDGGMSAQGKW